MKDNYEWEENDLFIPRYMEVDSDIGQEITAYIGAWEDMIEKFNIKADNDMDISIDMYAKFNPYADTLRIECKIGDDENKLSKTFDYDATDAERKLIKTLVIDRIKAAYKQTPKEFCESAAERKHPTQMNAANMLIFMTRGFQNQRRRISRKTTRLSVTVRYHFIKTEIGSERAGEKIIPHMTIC